MKKDGSIGQLLAALALDERGWFETDHWDGDLCAIGIAREGEAQLAGGCVGDQGGRRHSLSGEILNSNPIPAS